MDSASLVPRFPQELLDKIIAENGADKPTLRSCALVCRAFVPSSQAQIFSEIHLVEQPADDTQQLYNILVNKPPLRSILRILTVELEHGDDREQYYAYLVSILQLLPSVTSFTLFNMASQWCDFPNHLRTAICGFCERSDLISLRLCGLKTFAELEEFTQLVGSPALKELVLRAVFLPIPKDGGTPRSSHIGLTALDLDFVNTWLIEGVSLSMLRRLHVAWDADTLPSVRRLLNALPSLENLTLKAYNFMIFDDFSNALSLNLKHLRILELGLVMHFAHPQKLCPLLARLLESCGKGLEKLILSFSLVDELPAIEWEPLVNILTMTNFPALAAVEVWARQTHSEPDTYPEAVGKFLADVRRGLHHLDCQGILKCAPVDT
ncbi:hypothetical protein C8R47DRAFT_748901 [Mycena vitilis]|nr:hypothetical protein C8R47DRAFT_748901 [Mycena vitilis]